MKLELKNISISFGEQVIFNNFNQIFEQGIYSLLGESGVGKTTLMRCIAGLNPNHSGDVLLNGDKIMKPTKQIFMMHQDYSVFPWLNALDNLLFVLKAQKVKNTQEIQEEAISLLKKMNLDVHINKYPFELSGGMRQRLSVALALFSKADIILMDEPISALDVVNSENIIKLIKEHQKKHKNIFIIVSHNEKIINDSGIKTVQIVLEKLLQS